MCCIKMEVLTASIHSLTEEKGKLMQENKQLSESLTDETKIKISLFSFVSETRRKQEATEEQLAWKNKEIAQLKQPDQPVISNGTSPYLYKDTTISLSNNNMLCLPLLLLLLLLLYILPYHCIT